MLSELLIRNFHVLVGFDGFVDEILECVDVRLSPDSYTPITDIHSFSKKIEAAIGKSGNIEWISKSIQLGGNAPLLATALLQQNCTVDFVGACGKDSINSVFQPLQHKCTNFFSLTDPGYTNAVEFQDGKIFFGKTSSLSDITPELIDNRIGIHRFFSLFTNIDAFACVNWTMTPHMNALWEWLIANMPKLPKRPLCLIDLADPKKRTIDDLKQALLLIQKMQTIFDVCLSLNQSEAEQVSALLGGNQVAIEQIRTQLQISYCVLHTKHICTLSSEMKTIVLDVPFFEQPVRLTGAGDNFNAGLILGLLQKNDEREALEWAIGTAQYLVRQGESPTTEEIKRLLSSLNMSAHLQ